MGARCDPHSIAGEGSFNSNDLHHNHLNMTTDDDDDLYSSFVIIIIPFMHYLYFKDVTSASEFPCLKVRHSTTRRYATCHQIGLGSYTTSSSNGPRERQTDRQYQFTRITSWECATDGDAPDRMRFELNSYTHHLQPLGWDTHNYIIKCIVKWDLETHLSVDEAMKIVAHSTKSKCEAHNDKSVCVCFDSTQSVIVVVEWRTDPANGEHVADWIVSGQAVVVERNG